MSKNVENIVLEFQNGIFQENAGSKAPADVSTILVNNGFRKFYFITNDGSIIKQLYYLIVSTFKIVVSTKRGSILLCQYPIYSKKGIAAFRFIRKILFIKRVQIVVFIHDILSIRSGSEISEEIKELNKNNILIVHSNQMALLLKNSGCTCSFVVLGLFDYLVNNNYVLPRYLSHTITYAGNLSKSGFISCLEEVTRNSTVKFVLYGRNDNDMCFGNGIEYDGLFHPNDVSSLKGSWGLVWDGPSINELTDKAGLYQKINSPHKASLYLVAGLPLIVSSQSAIANIVIDNKLGFTVDSLMDIDDKISSITKEDYAKILESVRLYGGKLKLGHNLLNALKQIA